MRWVIAFVLALCLAAPAQAAPPVVAAYGSNISAGAGNQTVTLGATPTNGYTIAVHVDSVASGGGCPTNVHDSNSVNLTLETSQTSSGGSESVCAYDYVVTGSPGTVFTCTINAASSCAYIFIVEISGIGSPNAFAGANGASSNIASGSLTAQPGSLLFCTVNASATPGEAPTNATTPFVINFTGGIKSSYATLNGGSSACNGNSVATWAVVMAAYGASNGCPPNTYPCVFQAAKR